MRQSFRILFLVSLLCGWNLRAEDPIIAVIEASSTHPVEPIRLYGALDSSLEHAVTGYNIGWRVALISIRWDKFEPQRGVIAQIKRKKLAFRELGYKLQVDFGVQYAPAWVFEQEW